MNIADLFFGSHLDDSGLLDDARRSGDKAGAELGSRIGKGLGIALKGGLGLVAGGAAIALRGLKDLDEFQAKFQRDTGATAAEARDAAKAVNEIAGRNLQSLGQVGDTMTAVRVQMGLTGKELARVTDLTLKYATATGQDSVEAVKALDDIQDAWNLTAGDTQAVMDELIASHQKYGGEISANQRALAAMAPQLQALNADWRDGIGLLNLFAASGLDSEKALTALNFAVKNLKPGQNLDDLVREISSIEDPTKRAQKAIEIFGAKGGVALANALRPGVNSLKEFEISATDAAGATDKAASAALSFTDRVKLGIKRLGAEIIGLGQDFGPVLSGLAAVASLGGSLGLDKVLAGGWRKVAGSGLVRAAAAEAGVVIGAVYGTAAGAAEHIVELVKEAWKELAGSAAVKLLATKAGAIVGAVYGGAAKFAEAIAEGVSDAFLKLPGAPKVRAAVLAAATELGALQGTAMGSALTAAFAAAPLIVPILLVPQLTKLPSLLPEGDQKTIADAFWNALNDPDALSKAARAAAANPTAQAGAASAGTAIGEKAGDAMVNAWTTNNRLGPELIANARTGTEKAGDAMIAAWNATAPHLHGTVRAIAGKIADDLSGVGVAKAAYRNALLVMGQWAQGFRDGRDGVDQAWQDMLDGLTHPVTVTAETTKLLGELVSKKLQEGIRSGDPAVRDQAQYTKQLILDRLNDLKPRAGTLGKDSVNFLKQGMKSKDPDVRAAATAIYNAAQKPIAKLPAAGTAAGHGVGVNLVSQLDDERGPVGAAATRLGQTIARNILGGILYGGTSSAKTGKDDLITHRAAGGPVEAGVPYTVGEFHPETFIPRVPGYILPFDLRALFGQLPWAGAGAGDTYNIAVKLEGKAAADKPIDVARQLSRFAKNGAFTTPKRK